MLVWLLTISLLIRSYFLINVDHNILQSSYSYLIIEVNFNFSLKRKSDPFSNFITIVLSLSLIPSFLLFIFIIHYHHFDFFYSQFDYY